MKTHEKLQAWADHAHGHHQKMAKSIKAEVPEEHKDAIVSLTPTQERLIKWQKEWGTKINSDNPHDVAAAKQALRQAGFDPDYPPIPSE